MRRPGALGACLLLAGCGGGGGSGTTLEPGPSVEGFAFSGGSEVADGQSIDPRFTCDGENARPRLAWEGVPERAEELALALEDPDSPGGTFTHWLVFGVDPSVTVLPGGAWTGYGSDAPLEGENDFGDRGYGGPCPPGGEEHRYVFRLLALDAPSGLAAGADRAAFDDAVAPHLLAEARLTATYARE
jgi:Raf kinase inhibitor-like YbhB/YbcL family protein